MASKKNEKKKIEDPIFRVSKYNKKITLSKEVAQPQPRQLRKMDRSMKKWTQLLKSDATSPKTPITPPKTPTAQQKIAPKPPSLTKVKTYPPKSVLLPLTPPKDSPSSSKNLNTQSKTLTPQSKTLTPQSKTVTPQSKTVTPQSRSVTLQSKTQSKKRPQKRKHEAIEYHPDKLKRINNNKKITLEHKSQFTKVAELNKRKKSKPHHNAPSVEAIAAMYSNKIDNNIYRGLSVTEVICMRDETEDLTDEDLMAILTCPSPVWWEDQASCDDDPIPPIKLPHLELPSTRDNGKKATDNENTNKNLEVTLEVLKIVEEKFEPKFLKKRSTLENLLTNMKVKGGKSENNATIIKTDVNKVNTVPVEKITEDKPCCSKSLNVANNDECTNKTQEEEIVITMNNTTRFILLKDQPIDVEKPEKLAETNENSDTVQSAKDTEELDEDTEKLDIDAENSNMDTVESIEIDLENSEESPEEAEIFYIDNKKSFEESENIYIENSGKSMEETENLDIEIDESIEIENSEEPIDHNVKPIEDNKMSISEPISETNSSNSVELTKNSFFLIDNQITNHNHKTVLKENSNFELSSENNNVIDNKQIIDQYVNLLKNRILKRTKMADENLNQNQFTTNNKEIISGS